MTVLPAQPIAANRQLDGVRAPLPKRFNMMGLATLYLLTLRQHLHGKRWIVMVILFLLPAGLADLVRLTAPREVPGVALEFMFVFMLIPHAVLPLAALIYASGIIQDEQEDQTITYLLIRPLPKWAIYVVKLLATITTTLILTWVFTTLTYAAIYLGAATTPPDLPMRCLTAAGIHSLGVMTYCCLFGLLSLLTKRVLVTGILYVIVIEGILANLPFGVRLITVIYYTRLIAYRSLDFIVSQYGRVENIAAEAWQFDIQKDPNLLEHPTMQTCFIVLLSACVVFTALAAFICTRREFHVKTPEKN
jgi:ABC-2 type transport system permease protein